MKVESLKLFSYDLKLKRPLFLKGETLTSRRGFILQMGDSEGRLAACDIAPLPWSGDFDEKVIESYRFFKEKLIGSFWSLKLLLSKENILNEELSTHRVPALFFAFEFALLSLLMPKFSLFNPVNINSLLMGSDEAILSRMEEMKDYESIKVKVGPRTPEEMIELMNRLVPLMSDHQKIRLDGNQSWTLRQTLYFCEHFPIERCEYFEEPLQNPTELLELSAHTSLPLGFDESLALLPLDFLLSIPTKKALIIKPSLIGSLQKMNTLYQKACKHRLLYILSSCFESGLGHLMIAHLSRYLGLQSPIGLDTYHWLKEDLLLDPLNFLKGQLHLPGENLIKPRLNYKLLEEVNV